MPIPAGRDREQAACGVWDVAPYNRTMRSRLNSALVVAAGSLALVLTVIRQSPEGVVSLGLDTQEVRAAPGEARNTRHDLSALKIFNLVLVRIKERYVKLFKV